MVQGLLGEGHAQKQIFNKRTERDQQKSNRVGRRTQHTQSIIKVCDTLSSVDEYNGPI